MIVTAIAVTRLDERFDRLHDGAPAASLGYREKLLVEGDQHLFRKSIFA
jgi:hypothetical protein